MKTEFDRLYENMENMAEASVDKYVKGDFIKGMVGDIKNLLKDASDDIYDSLNADERKKVSNNDILKQLVANIKKNLK